MEPQSATESAIKLVRPLRRESTIGQILQKLEQKVQTAPPKSYVKVINVENDTIIRYPLPASDLDSTKPEDVVFQIPEEAPHSITMHFISQVECPHCHKSVPLTYEVDDA